MWHFEENIKTVETPQKNALYKLQLWYSGENASNSDKRPIYESQSIGPPPQDLKLRWQCV